MREIVRRLRAAWTVLRYGADGAPDSGAAPDHALVNVDELRDTLGLCFLGVGLPREWPVTATSSELAILRSASAFALGLRVGDWERVQRGEWSRFGAPPEGVEQ